MKRIFLAVVFALFVQLWMPQTSAQDVWATSYDGMDVYVVTESLSKERIPGVTCTVYTGMVKFVRGNELLNTAKYCYKGSDDGLIGKKGGKPELRRRIRIAQPLAREVCP